MSKSKIKKKVQNNLKILQSAPEELIGETKLKIFLKITKKIKKKEN